MAINTHRAPRRTEEYLVPRHQTSENVAPGTYANTHNEPIKSATEAPVPFFSLQEKVLNPNKGASAITPGPGAYVGPKVQNGAGTKANGDDSLGLGSVSMKSQVKRLAPTAPGSSVYITSTVDKNPGPGTYKTDSELLAFKTQKELVKPVKPVLEAERTMPSIPRQKLEPGMQQDADPADAGEVEHLYMRHTGEHHDMVGPGEYDPEARFVIQRRLFHNSRTTRKLWEPSSAIESCMPPRDNPGPGSYDVKPAFVSAQPVDSLTEAVSTYQFSSNSPMAHQATLNPDKASPGPGRYEVHSYIERTIKTARERNGLSGDRGSFGGMTQRVGWARDVHQPYKDPYNRQHVPGPGHYPTRPSSFHSDAKKVENNLPVAARKKQYHGVHHPALIMALQETPGPLQAFNSTDDRACNKKVQQGTPAPGHYHREGSRSHSMQADLRERAKVGRKGVFGTCADRFYGSPLEGRQGPDFTNIIDDKAVRTNTEHRSMFLSESPRFHSATGPHEASSTKVGNADTPAPGDYSVEKEPNYRSPYRTPRQGHLAFGSGKQRFESGKDVFAEHTPGLLNPGPGEYAEAKPDRIPGGAPIKEKRKAPVVGSTTETVGPGSYSEEIGTHMLRKTFNISTQATIPRRDELNSVADSVYLG